MWFECISPKSMGWQLNPQHNTVDFLEPWVPRTEDKRCYHSSGIATVEGVPNKGTNPAPRSLPCPLQCCILQGLLSSPLHPPPLTAQQEGPRDLGSLDRGLPGL